MGIEKTPPYPIRQTEYCQLSASRLLRSQSRRLLKWGGDYAWNLAASVATQGSTLLIAVILTHMLSVEEFGRYVIGQSTVVALGSLFGLGLGFVANTLLARYAATEPSRAESIHRFGMTVVCLSGIFAAVLVSSGSGWLAEHLFHDADAQIELFIAGVALPFAVVGNYQFGALSGLGAFRGLAGAAALGGVGLLSAVSVGAWVAGPAGALCGLLLSLVLRSGFSFAVLHARRASFHMRDPNRGLEVTWREIRGYALPALLSGLTLTPAIWLSNAILTTHVSTGAFGLFASAFLIKTLVTFVPLQFGSVLLSRLSSLSGRGDMVEWRRTHSVVLLAGTGIAVVLALPLAIGSRQVMGVFGPGFAEGALLLRWLMLCSVLEAAATLTFYGFPGRGHFWRAALVYSVPKDILLLWTALPLVERFGAVGLAWAHCISWGYGMFALTALNVLRWHRASVMGQSNV